MSKGRLRGQITACPHIDKLHYCKGMCLACYAKFKRDRDPTFPKKHRDRTYWYKLKTKFGITKEDYITLLKLQGRCCLICKNRPSRKKRMVVDHCHRTNEIRGLLCSKCNTGLGMFDDRLELLEQAYNYVLQFGRLNGRFKTTNTSI